MITQLTCQHNFFKIFFFTVLGFLVCVFQVAHYVWNKSDFDAVDPEATDYLMGNSFFSSRFHSPLTYYTFLSLCRPNFHVWH